MIKTLRIAALSVTMLAGAACAYGADFMSTAEPSSFFNLGVRVGLNTSNRTVAKNTFNLYNHSAWGTGFEGGVVANLNFRDFISVQPGFFFECHSGNYTYINSRDILTQENIYQWGHTRTYDFTIPLLAVLHFNLTDNLRWNAECGPYISLKLGSKLDPAYTGLQPDDYREIEARSVNWGLKIGTGFTLLEHYYLGAHYMWGFGSPWQDPVKGRAKAWTFTLGYDF